jgi:hypothetical protein
VIDVTATKLRNQLIVILVAVGALIWVFGWPNPNFQDEEKGRMVTLIAQSSNDTLIIGASVVLTSQGKVIDEQYQRVRDNSWHVDVYVAEGDRITATLVAWVYREEAGTRESVSVKIVDNGAVVKANGPIYTFGDVAQAETRYHG